MSRITQALITTRDWIWPPEPEPQPEPPAPRQRVVGEVQAHIDIVHPLRGRDADSTEDTVQAWLDAAVAPVPVDGCFHCDRAPQEHGLRYAALVGPHHYAEPTVFQVNQCKRAHDRTHREDAC